MYSKQLRITSFIATVLLLSCLADQAFSLKCYTCESEVGGECDRNPEQEKYIQECKFDFNSSLKRVPTLTTLLNKYKMKSTLDDFPIDPSTFFDCMKITLDTFGTKSVSRTCAPKMITCEAFDQVFKENFPFIQMEQCSRCDNDLCNSS